MQRSDPSTNSDRTWPLPRVPWMIRMTWSKLLFAHWPVDPKSVERWIPDGLTLDTRDHQAWIGVVPFLMSDTAPRGCPALPYLSRFAELNVRTYVIKDGKPGVWFFSLDAANPIAVRAARATFNLPYMDAKMSIDQDDDASTRYQSQRTHSGEPAADFDATYRSQGDSFTAQRGTLEHWLTARYCLYSSDRKGKLYRGEIDHPPWALSPANCEIRNNTMGSHLGFDFTGTPHLLHAADINVRAWWAARC